MILAVALLAGTWSFAALAAVTVGFDDPTSRRPDPSDGLLFEPAPFASFGSIGLGDGLQAAGFVAFGIGLALLVLAALADRVRLPGLGTPLIVVGVIGGSLGAWAIVPDQAVLRALLPLLVIAIAMAVGVLGSRKATTWLAALAGVSALGQLALALLGSDPEPAAVAALLAVFGLVLLARGRCPGGPASAPGGLGSGSRDRRAVHRGLPRNPVWSADGPAATPPRRARPHRPTRPLRSRPSRRRAADGEPDRRRSGLDRCAYGQDDEVVGVDEVAGGAVGQVGAALPDEGPGRGRRRPHQALGEHRAVGVR